MASTFKTFLNNDIVSSRTLLHEVIPLTGSIVSGTYGAYQNESNIKNYNHGMFQSVYDYPYLSASSNHVFDITVGYSADSILSSSLSIQNSKKINIYNNLSQVLMGHDYTGSINLFDEDGDLLAGGTKLRECVFFNFARMLTKDEIKKGTVEIKLGSTAAFATANNTRITLADAGAQNDFRVNSPVGEYGILNAIAGKASGAPTAACGLVFYQAGIVVITSSVFLDDAIGGRISSSAQMNSSGKTITQTLTGSTIQENADYIRHRIYDIRFNNTTELNSTIYFCRANHNDFNYSTNPTYLSGSKIVVKESTLDEPISYITSVGLYSEDNELLAVAKLSEPLKKTSSTEMTLRVRLDY